jgi:hypothetical protein
MIAGNLRIAAVTQADFNSERECRIMNRITNVDAGGSTSKIENSNEPAGKINQHRSLHPNNRCTQLRLNLPVIYL